MVGGDFVTVVVASRDAARRKKGEGWVWEGLDWTDDSDESDWRDKVGGVKAGATR